MILQLSSCCSTLRLLVLPRWPRSATTPTDLAAGLRYPLFASALWLSARTTVVALVAVLAAGTPLPCWLAAARGGLIARSSF